MRNIAVHVLFVFLILSIVSCDKKPETPQEIYFSAPVYLRSIALDHTDTEPYHLVLSKDTLYLSYKNSSRIELYNLLMEKVDEINLVDQEEVMPTFFDVYRSSIVVTEVSKQRVILYNRDGKIVNSFSTLPDGNTPLAPFNLSIYRGVAYVSDLIHKSILAVSIVDTEDLTEIGELILTIPSDEKYKIDFPSAVKVTPDGRLLVGDATDNELNVFTCDGQYIYDFDSIPDFNEIIPQAFAYDNLIDPELKGLDSTSFDPSVFRKIGRLHMIDANSSIVHMYNPNGKYISSYPDDDDLENPTGIAINQKSGLIYIVDSKAKEIKIYSTVSQI